MAMNRTAIEKEIRDRFLSLINELLVNAGEELLAVSANEYAIPCVDAEGNESCAVIKVSVPRGTRNGEGGYDAYDPYEAAESYKLDVAEKAEKKKAAEEKKAAKIAADAKRRAEKAAAKAEKEGE